MSLTGFFVSFTLSFLSPRSTPFPRRSVSVQSNVRNLGRKQIPETRSSIWSFVALSELSGRTTFGVFWSTDLGWKSQDLEVCTRFLAEPWWSVGLWSSLLVVFITSGVESCFSQPFSAFSVCSKAEHTVPSPGFSTVKALRGRLQVENLFSSMLQYLVTSTSDFLPIDDPTFSCQGYRILENPNWSMLHDIRVLT